MKFSFEQGIAAGVAGLVATALIAGVLLVDHGAIAAPVEASAQTQALPVPTAMTPPTPAWCSPAVASGACRVCSSMSKA
nr:hypothetical protein [Stenotrophomonas maltophilia]